MYNENNKWYAGSNVPENETNWRRNATAECETEYQQDDAVNSPKHYVWLKDLCGVEPIDICEYMDFCLGNAIKYCLRAGHKHEEGMTDAEKAIQDLNKAIFYLNREIEHIKHKNFIK